MNKSIIYTMTNNLVELITQLRLNDMQQYANTRVKHISDMLLTLSSNCDPAKLAHVVDYLDSLEKHVADGIMMLSSTIQPKTIVEDTVVKTEDTVEKTKEDVGLQCKLYFTSSVFSQTDYLLLKALLHKFLGKHITEQECCEMQRGNIPIHTGSAFEVTVIKSLLGNHFKDDCLHTINVAESFTTKDKQLMMIYQDLCRKYASAMNDISGYGSVTLAMKQDLILPTFRTEFHPPSKKSSHWRKPSWRNLTIIQLIEIVHDIISDSEGLGYYIRTTYSSAFTHTDIFKVQFYKSLSPCV